MGRRPAAREDGPADRSGRDGPDGSPPPVTGVSENVSERFAAGVGLIASGRYFDAHEELELAWRAAARQERDFFQGLVHVAVAWYQAGRGNAVGCRRQLEKAARRLAPYAPAHRGLELTPLLAHVERARRTAESGDLDLPKPPLRRSERAQADRVERPPERDLQPPVAVEEEQQPQEDEHRATGDLDHRVPGT